MNHKRLFPRNERNSHTNIGRGLYTAFLTTTLTASLCLSASAATVWEKANEIMKDVYKQILGISTIAAIVTAAVALLMMNFPAAAAPWMKAGLGSSESSSHGLF